MFCIMKRGQDRVKTGSKYYVFNIGDENRVKMFREKTQEDTGMKTSVDEREIQKVYMKCIILVFKLSSPISTIWENACKERLN